MHKFIESEQLLLIANCSIYLSISCDKELQFFSQEKPVENSIRQKLTQTLGPTHLEVINESYMHSVPKGVVYI